MIIVSEDTGATGVVDAVAVGAEAGVVDDVVVVDDDVVVGVI
jgi:hypothetical protein